MAHLGSQWNTVRVHLGALGSHFGVLGNHFGIPGIHFGRPRPPFRGSLSVRWPQFFDVVTFLLKMRKSYKNLCFPMVFNDFRGLEVIKSTKNLKKLRPESFEIPNEPQRRAGLAKLAARMPNVGPMVAQWGPKWLVPGGGNTG